MRSSPISVLSCFSQAFQLIFSAGFRRFIVIPLILNVLIFIALSSATFDYAQTLFTNIESHLPHWLAWVKWLLWPLLALMMLITYAYCFNFITTIIAAPFLGLLAEKIATHITGITPPNEPLPQLIARTFRRELTKLGYFLPRSFGMLLLIFALIFLPGANILGALLGSLWGSWCLALQFCDYTADNHQIPFYEVRAQLSQQKSSSLVFGGLALLGSMIPILNIVITPLAVAAGTIYWVRKTKPINL